MADLWEYSSSALQERYVYIDGGEFRPGVLRDGDGIPPGVYAISVLGVTNVEPDPDPDPYEDNPTPSVSLIHSRYNDHRTSGLTLDTSQSRVLDLVLDPAE